MTDLHELARQGVALEDRMNTKPAEYRTDIARLAEQMAQRDKDNLRWTIGLWVAAIIILGILVRWPA